jgi:hypothetical protein
MVYCAFIFREQFPHTIMIETFISVKPQSSSFDPEREGGREVEEK